MSNAQHIRGPWKVGEATGGNPQAQAFEIVEWREGEDLSIAEVNVQEMCGTDEALAKARLIAAAPDQHKALCQAVVLLAELGITEWKCDAAGSTMWALLAKETVMNAKAAIAKATGGK